MPTQIDPVHAAIPATVVAAASFDDAIAITGYTLFINLAVREGGNPTWSVMHGPLSVLFGLLAGVLAGFMCSITKLWDNSFKRTLVMFFSSAQPLRDHPALPCQKVASETGLGLTQTCFLRSSIHTPALSHCT